MEQHLENLTIDTNGYGSRQYLPLAVVEYRPNGRRSVTVKELPQRFGNFYHIPHYVAKGRGITVLYWDTYKYD